MSVLLRTLATAYILCLCTLPGSSVSRGAEADDWLTYNRTLAGDRFSPLGEIDRSDVAQLKAICTYTLPEVSSLQTGPLVVDGTMYFTTDEGSYAIDASTCAEKWKQHRVRRPAALSTPICCVWKPSGIIEKNRDDGSRWQRARCRDADGVHG
jgi:hypothetical protein